MDKNAMERQTMCRQATAFKYSIVFVLKLKSVWPQAHMPYATHHPSSYMKRSVNALVRVLCFHTQKPFGNFECTVFHSIPTARVCRCRPFNLPHVCSLPSSSSSSVLWVCVRLSVSDKLNYTQLGIDRSITNEREPLCYDGCSFEKCVAFSVFSIALPQTSKNNL